MSEAFFEFLATADEDTKRAASDWQYHYPTEIEVWDEEDVDNDAPSRTLVVCGCSTFGHPWGSPGHGDQVPPTS